MIADKLENLIGKTSWSKLSADQQHVKINQMLDVFDNDTKNGAEYVKSVTVQDRINEFLHDTYGVSVDDYSKIYHPSAIEHYPKAETSSDGNVYLGAPRISAIKNPVFNRTMHRLKTLVNKLIEDGIVDSNTEIHIEMTRELNDANRRKAVQQYQKQREDLRTGYAKKIKEFWDEKGLSWTQSNTDILKYQLWEEQGHICPYTGKTITLTDFLGDNPTFDIEHTFPRSKTCDNSQENMTLTCREYNRQTKRTMIPSELPKYDEIWARVQAFGWENKVFGLKKIIEKTRNVPTDPEAKSRVIIKRHFAELEMRYYQNKLFRFKAEEIPDGFASNQLRNTQTICKYAMLYMKTVFDRVYSYKALGLKPFYEAWGVNEKARISHINHGIDAVLAACIDRSSYDEVARFYHEKELYEWGKRARPKTIEPWSGFSAYMNNEIHNDILVTHHTIDKLLKKSKKKVRKRGVIQRKPNGEPLIAQGDSARGSLHKETFYGAIKSNDEVKYVVRKKIVDMNAAEKNKIVDLKIREIVLANEEKIKNKEKIWLNEEKGIEIKSARYDASSAVSNPVSLKQHQYISDMEYKQNYYVANSGNYAMALYGRLTEEDTLKHISSYQVISSYDAVVFTANNRVHDDMFLKFDEDNMPLRAIIKMGTRIILYDKKPNEIKALTKECLLQRLYNVFGIPQNGQLNIRKHMIVKGVKGSVNFEFSDGTPEFLIVVPKNKRMLIEYSDFEIDILGNVKFLF